MGKMTRITDIFCSAILLSVNRVADEASRVATELYLHRHQPAAVLADLWRQCGRSRPGDPGFSLRLRNHQYDLPRICDGYKSFLRTWKKREVPIWLGIFDPEWRQHCDSTHARTSTAAVADRVAEIYPAVPVSHRHYRPGTWRATPVMSTSLGDSLLAQWSLAWNARSLAPTRPAEYGRWQPQSVPWHTR